MLQPPYHFWSIDFAILSKDNGLFCGPACKTMSIGTSSTEAGQMGGVAGCAFEDADRHA
jgi:hypothetical protein